MIAPRPRFFFDLVDPLSYLVDRELNALEARSGTRIERVPLELRPPPAPLIDPDDPAWRKRWERARSLVADVELREPPLVPWTRKAMELVLHGRELGREDDVRRALFAAGIEEGRDLGRVDVLVDVARELGLDHSRAKAVLDVDRHSEAVRAARTDAAELGVAEPPALVAGGRVLRGFHNRDALDTFLQHRGG